MACATGKACVLWLSLTAAAFAAEAPPKKAAPIKTTQPDLKFLEYLGTLEGDGENWTEIAALALATPEGKANAKPEAAAKSAAEKK